MPAQQYDETATGATGYTEATEEDKGAADAATTADPAQGADAATAAAATGDEPEWVKCWDNLSQVSHSVALTDNIETREFP